MSGDALAAEASVSPTTENHDCETTENLPAETMDSLLCLSPSKPTRLCVDGSPSVGSAEHASGQCNPCVFENKHQHCGRDKCWKGSLCERCHEWHPRWIKPSRRARKRASIGEANSLAEPLYEASHGSSRVNEKPDAATGFCEWPDHAGHNTHNTYGASHAGDWFWAPNYETYGVAPTNFGGDADVGCAAWSASSGWSTSVPIEYGAPANYAAQALSIALSPGESRPDPLGAAANCRSDGSSRTAPALVPPLPAALDRLTICFQRNPASTDQAIGL